MARLPITGDDEADALLDSNPLALLIGMLLDQQVPMEWAFRGPLTLERRLGEPLSARAIALVPAEELVTKFCDKPALHRYPAAMARRTHALAVHLMDEVDGDPAALWRDRATAKPVLADLLRLPGYGEEKARILLAILAKRFDVRPRGWKTAAAPFSDAKPRSAADVSSKEALSRVRAFKKAQKAKGLGKAD